MAAPTTLLAQDELTLEGLAEVVEGMKTEFVIFAGELRSVKERLTAIEERMTPGEEFDEDGKCLLAMVNRVHVLSLTSYLEKYPGEVAPSGFDLISVKYVPGAGTEITFEAKRNPGGSGSIYGDRFVTETWDGCNYVSSSGWWAEDWKGDKIDD